jgi:hypothetical protein
MIAIQSTSPQLMCRVLVHASLPEEDKSDLQQKSARSQEPSLSGVKAQHFPPSHSLVQVSFHPLPLLFHEVAATTAGI